MRVLPVKRYLRFLRVHKILKVSSGVNFTNPFMQSTNTLEHSIWRKRCHLVSPTKLCLTPLVHMFIIFAQLLWHTLSMWHAPTKWQSFVNVKAALRSLKAVRRMLLKLTPAGLSFCKYVKRGLITCIRTLFNMKILEEFENQSEVSCETIKTSTKKTKNVFALPHNSLQCFHRSCSLSGGLWSVSKGFEVQNKQTNKFFFKV